MMTMETSTTPSSNTPYDAPYDAIETGVPFLPDSEDTVSSSAVATAQHESDMHCPEDAALCLKNFFLCGIFGGTTAYGMIYGSIRASISALGDIQALSGTLDCVLHSLLWLGCHMGELCFIAFAGVLCCIPNARGSKPPTQFFKNHFHCSGEKSWTSRSSFVAVVVVEGGFFFGLLIMLHVVEFFNDNHLPPESVVFATFMDLPLPPESLAFATFMDLAVCLCMIFLFNCFGEREDTLEEEERCVVYTAVVTV
jgi:hypothetical protein